MSLPRLPGSRVVIARKSRRDKCSIYRHRYQSRLFSLISRPRSTHQNNTRTAHTRYLYPGLEKRACVTRVVSINISSVPVVLFRGYYAVGFSDAYRNLSVSDKDMLVIDGQA